MLRTNNKLLSYFETLDQSGKYPGEISVKRYEKQAQLLEQGDKINRVIVLKQGITKCFFREENGKEYILQFLGACEIVGELEVIRNMDCLCSIQALTEVRAYVFTAPLFRLLLEKDLEFNQLLIKEVAERIANTSSKSSFQQLYSVEHGLHRILALNQQQKLSLTKSDIAAYLGITIRSLNRLLLSYRGEFKSTIGSLSK